MTSVHPPGWMLVLGWDLHHVGGVSQVVANLYDSLAGGGKFRPVLVISRWHRATTEHEKIDGRRTYYLPFREPAARQRKLLALAGFLFTLPLQLVRCARIVRRERITVVNVHFPGLSALLWILLRKLQHFELILSFHGSDLRAPLEARGLERWLWLRLLRNADVISSCSETISASIVGEFGVTAARVRTVDNGVNPKAIIQAAENAGGSTAPPDFVLSLGTVEKKKGHDILIRAFDGVAQRYPALHLVIGGRLAEPECMADLESLRARSIAPERIHLMKDLPHENAMGLLAKARIFVLASRLEPFGIVVLEAGVLRRPTIATNVCGVVQRLDPERDIYSIPPEDVIALEEAILSALADPIAGRHRADALHDRVVSRFTWVHVSEQYESLLGACAQAP